MWEKSFVGVSVLLGGSLEDARGMVTPASPAASQALDALTTQLADPRRAARAQALAVVAQAVVVAIDEVTLR